MAAYNRKLQAVQNILASRTMTEAKAVELREGGRKEQEGGLGLLTD